VPIECRSSSKVTLTKAENISISGLLVRCTEVLEHDSEISVAFTLPGSLAAISAAARVAHCVPGAFMGLEFIKLPPDAREKIDEYIASVAPAAKPR
jgi:hypothetical protein